MPNPNFGNIQYKASNGLIKLDELEGIVECFVSGIGNKDSVGDICATGAFAKSLQRRKPRVVWGHNWNDPIGKVLEIYEVPASDPRLPMKMKMAGIGGLYAKVQFNLQSEKGKEAFANVAFFGEEQEWSIGYKTLRAQYDDNLQANVLYEVELYEVSPVLHGANQLTGTISVKSDEEKMHGMMPLVIGAPSAPAPRRDGIFDEGMSQTISGPQLAGVVAELSRRAGGPVMVVNATENSVVFVKPGKGKFRIGYHFTGSEYMFGKPELIHAEQAKPPVQSGPSPMPGIVGKPNKPSTNNPAMPMPVAMKPGNGGMVMVPLPRVEYDGMDKDKKPELVAEERELAESLVRIAGKYGKFDEDGSGIWAGYYPPEKNKVKDIGVKCSNCVLYLGGDKCKILDIKVEAEGKCRFAIIPDGVVVGYGKKEYNEILDEEEIKMVEDIEAKYPGEFILGVLRNTIKKRRRKRRRYKTLEEWGVEEQELMEKGLDPFLAQDSSYVIPVDPTDAFEFKSMIDPVLEYHRIDTFVNEYGVVIASQLDQEAKDALETASLSAYEFLKKKIAFKEIEEKALGRRIGRAIGSRAINRPNIGGKKRRSGRGMGVPSGDLDPRTRRDSNLDGILFDNIPGWEQPDPTPDGPGSINNPKPSKRQLTNAAKPDGKEKLSSGARNLRRHADRSADMEKQFPNAEENQKRSDHEAIAKAWDEQGLGWEEVPRYNADDNLSSDYLRGREIGVNQARVMWDGDSVRKRPEKFNEKQKASNEYSNWYSSYAKSVSAYLDAHSRDDSDNWDGIESALRADVKSKYPDTQDWAKEDIATLNEYLNDIGLLDIDKLKKKKKKKAGTEAEKGPDLQELRRLNSEGKLSSGDRNKPTRKKKPKTFSEMMDESDRLEAEGKPIESMFDDGWEKIENGFEMDAPDIDGMYRINSEGKGKYSVTRFTDIYRDGGQNALDEDIDRTFNSPSAAKKWAERDYDKIIESMNSDDGYAPDSSRLSSGAIPDSARQKRLIEAAESASARKPDGTETFAASVARQYRKNGKLSEKQWSVLDRMFGASVSDGASKISASKASSAPFSGKRRKIIDLADVPEYDYPNAPGGRKPTPEQSNAIDAMMTGDDVKISALAATGKTTTVINFAERLNDTEPESRALYLVFNANAKDDAGKRGMPGNVSVQTMDGVSFRAMRAINPEMTKKSFARETGHIKPLRTFAERAEYLGTRGTVEQGKELTAVDVFKRVAKAVDAFSVSDDTEIGPQHFTGAYNGGLKVEDPEVIAELLPFAKKMWEDMNTPRVASKGGDRGKGMLPMNNTNLTKMWALTNPDIGDGEGINAVMVDEAQDMNPVFAGILRNSNSIQRIYIGDSNQAINAWRGADGKTLENAYAKYNMPITDSFRFGKNIADRGNRFLNLLGRQERMNGRKTDKSGRPVDGRIGSISNPTMILTRSNGGGIAATLDSFEKGRIVHGSGNFKEDLSTFIDNIEYMTNLADGKGYFTDGDGKQVFGRPKESQDLDGISTLDEFNKAIEKKDNNRLNMLGKILDKYSIEELRDALDRIITDKSKLPKNRDEYVHIQTAHTSKGLESPRVLIWSDFRGPKRDSEGNWILPDEQELRLSYVAVTRAEEELELGSLSWIEKFESDVDPSSVRLSSGRDEFSPVAINAVSVEDDNSWMDRSAVGRGATTASGGKWNGAKPARSDIKPGADLSGADLRRMGLSGANLADANMEGADLTGADLTNARLIGVNLTGANLTNWQIAGADIFRAKLPKNWNGGNGAGSRMLPEARLSSGMRPSSELTDAEKADALTRLKEFIVEDFEGGKGFNIDLIVPNSPSRDDLDRWANENDVPRTGPVRTLREENTIYESLQEQWESDVYELIKNEDWEELERIAEDFSKDDIDDQLRKTPGAHPDYEMMLELDKDDQEWNDMMFEMRGDLSLDGSSEDEVERILDHWLYSSDSPKQEEYLDEYREPGDNYSDTFVRAARAMYQDHLERLYDNRQERNLSSGRRNDEQESRISDREVFERRMAGESLAETAKALGMKREEVRQAEMRHMARERGTLQKPDFDEIEAYREDQARMAAEEASELSLNESIYTRRMGGESLAEAAEALGMSREEVRTREQKHMQLMRSMDRQAKQWLDENEDGKFSSGSREYVSPLDDMEVGQRLSSGKLDEVYRSVQSKLIEQIERIQETGDGKWEFPWHKTSLPKNVTNNNRPYSGINSVMLMFKQDAMGYEMPLWAGFNQWKNLGGTVRKGEKGTLILIPTILPKKKDADGNEIRGSGGVFFKTGHVFNIDQIDGIDKEQYRVPELPEEERVAELEQALSEVGAVVNTGGDRAFYRPSTDEIHLPPFSSFKSKEGYYAVFAHELMHWTGHPSRLNRDHLGEFGSPEYAQEELIAEIASAFFMAAHGLTPEPREDHAQYLASWLKKLKSDPDAMKKAFGEAQKAHEYAISKSPSMSAKLGKKVAEAGVLPGNGDAGYGDIGPSLSSGRREKYVRNPEGTTRTLADEMGAFGDELLTRFDMARGGRINDRHYFVGRADFGESGASDNEWDVTQGENDLWSAALLRLEFNEDSDRDWAGVVSDEYDSPEDVAKWISDYEDTRKAWAKKFKEETDFEKISSMLEEETARRDAEYQDSMRIVNERYDRQQYTRMIAEIDESRLEWSAEDWADEASDIRMELAREDGRLSSGVRSRYDETPVETIGTVSNALKRTDEAGSNSRYIASRLAPVPADKYDFDSIRRNGESVSFTYGGKPRTIYPTGMMAKKGGGIYVIGLDDDQGQYRSYSLHKIEGLVDGADAPYNPTQPGVPRGVPGSSARKTRNVTSERLSSGRVRPIDEVRAAVDDFRYGNMVASRALRGEIGREDRNGFIEEISLDQHEEAIEAVNGLAELRDEMIRSMLGGEKMPADSNIFDIEKYADISEDDFNLLQDVDFAIDDIQSRLEFRENESSLLDEQIEDLKMNIAELENNFRDSRRIGSIVDFESAMQRHIDDSDGDREEAIDSIKYDAERTIDALQDIEDIENSFIDSSLQGQIDEIQELVDSIGENTTPEELASNLSGLYYGSVNRLESELSNLFDTQEKFRESGVGLDRKDRSRLPEDIFSSSNLSDFDMVEGDAADFLEPGDVPGLSSGRRSRTQGSRRRPMSDADRQAFADGVRQRAATIPGRRRPGPSKDEFDTDKLSSGRLYFPSELERNKVGRDLEDNVKIKFGRMSENNDRTPDGKWMLDASKLKQLLRDEDGKPLSNEESAKFLGISMREFERMLQGGSGISESDAYTFIDQAFTGGSNPAAVTEVIEAIWGFDSVPYWYDRRRGNLLTRADYNDYKDEGIDMDGELVPRDFDAVERVVASEISKNAFPLSALSESLGAQSDDDLVEAIRFEVDGEQIVTTPKQLAKWKKEGVPTAIIEQLVDRGIIPSAGDIFGEEGVKFDNSIRQFDLWKNVSDAIARNGKKVKGIDLDEIIGATKVQTRLRAFEEGKEGRFSKNTGKALRYSDEEVQEIVDRLNKKYGLDETVASIKGGPSMSSGRRAARRISNTGAEAAERLSSGRVNNGAPENITPRMQNEIMGWAENATWSNFAQSLVSQFKAQGFLSATQWTRLLQLHDNSKRRR
jgi:HK97 family phage prohead protease